MKKPTGAGAKTKKKRVSSPYGKIYINTTYNNTVVTATDSSGNVIYSSSAGKCGFKGSKKGTAYVSSVVSADVAKVIKSVGVEKVDILVKGPGTGRETAIRAIMVAGIKISSIKDITPIPHNGCKPRKRRRV